ncbi:hypothetical protein [Neobacillus endophyticus]|nr:hypothetical protein [Neobacillus endophyticus]
MAKNKDNQLKKNKNIQPKANADLVGENGLEKVVIRAQEKSK